MFSQAVSRAVHFYRTHFLGPAFLANHVFRALCTVVTESFVFLTISMEKVGSLRHLYIRDCPCGLCINCKFAITLLCAVCGTFPVSALTGTFVLRVPVEEDL